MHKDSINTQLATKIGDASQIFELFLKFAIESLLAFGAESFLLDVEPRKPQIRFDEPWTSERFKMFQKAVEHLKRSYHTLSRTNDSQIEVWGEVLKLLLVRSTSFPKKGNERLAVKSKYLEASKVISSVFDRYPELNAQLQALMAKNLITSCRTQ